MHARPTLAIGDAIELWRCGGDCIKCTINSKLGEGAGAGVVEVTADDEVRALKVGSFDACCDEAEILLHANHPRRHPHVLQLAFAHPPSDGMLKGRICFLEGRVRGVDLCKAMQAGGVALCQLHGGDEAAAQRRLVACGVQLAPAIEYLHERAILHEDVKPENVVVDFDDANYGPCGRVVLLDSGVAAQGSSRFSGGSGWGVAASLKGGTPAFCRQPKTSQSAVLKVRQCCSAPPLLAGGSSLCALAKWHGAATEWTMDRYVRGASATRSTCRHCLTRAPRGWQQTCTTSPPGGAARPPVAPRAGP